MVRNNCIDTMPGIRLSPSAGMSLTWRSWIADGKRLFVSEALRPVTLMKVWNHRVRVRRQLAMLDDHLVQDIGWTPSQIRHETQKPFWQDFGRADQ